MKLIVGLGNPGSKYRDSRHNVGFEVVDEVARRRGLVFESSPAEAVMARERGLGRGVILAKPHTFMNLSGQAVGALARYYRIATEDVLVVTDDASLPLGRLRARPGGSDGGHNGLRSVIELLGTQQVPRLRIGVGRGDLRRDLADHVLAGFEDAERETIAAAIVRAADAVELFVSEGMTPVMDHFNQAEPAGESSPADGSEQES